MGVAYFLVFDELDAFKILKNYVDEGLSMMPSYTSNYEIFNAIFSEKVRS